MFVELLAALFSRSTGDEVDVEDWYRRFGPMVLRRCRTLLRDEEEAVDAMQDTFVQVLRHAPRLDGGSPSSLLYRIATNTCLNRIRSRSRRPEDPAGEQLQAIAWCAGAENRSGAREILGMLFGAEPDSTATIAVMHLVEGHSHAEVADAVGMSVSGVRKRLRRLRGLLAELEGVTQ